MLNKISEIIIKRYKLILLLSIFVFAGAAALASNIGMDSKMDGMLPENSLSLKASKEFNKYFDSQDNVIIIAKGERAKCEGYMDALADRLYKDNLINNALYKIDTDSLDEYLHLYADTEEYEQLEAELRDGNSELSKFLQHMDFVSFSELFSKRLYEADMKKSEMLLTSFGKLLNQETLTEAEKEELFAVMLFGNMKEQAEESQYLVSDSGSTFMMIIKPKLDMDDFMNSRLQFFEGLEKAIDETMADKGYDIDAGYTGGAFVQDNESDNTMFNNFYSTAILTFIIIIAFIVVSFRRFVLPISAGYPLIIGAVMSTAAAFLLYSNLNLFSISFAVLLLGLGIDFAVHIISRYLEERSAGQEPSAAVSTAIKETSSGMLVGALTTAAAFFTFLTAEFRAFTQMGVISGAGILIMCFTMILVMPSLILAFDSRKKSQKTYKDVEYRFLKPLGMAVDKRPIVFIVIVIAIAALLSNKVLSSEIKSDISRLYPEDMECLKWLKVVEEEFDYNPTTLQFMADDMAELKKCSSELLKRSDVKQVDSVLKYLPEDQDYKLSVIKELNRRLKKSPENNQANPLQVIEAFKSIKKSADRNKIDDSTKGYKTIEGIINGLQTENADLILQQLGQTGASSFPSISGFQISEDPMSVEQLPEALKTNYVGRGGKYIIEIVPAVNIWEPESFNKLEEAVLSLSGNYPVGMPSIMNEVTDYVKSDILRISIYCFAALFIILMIMFRGIKETIIAIVPLCFTVYATLGLMPILGADLNIFSMIAFPVLIGIGIDSAVHLVHRIKTTPGRDTAYILAHTGKAIMMTNITTLIGFGSLYFTNHPGLESFGLTTVIGMSLCLVFTLTMVPALYKIMYKKKES
ncbi:MAG: efflux RND transporter permease subunit [Bacillota bacterium]